MPKSWFCKAAFIILAGTTSAIGQSKFSATGMAASNLKVPKDFKVEQIYTVPKDKEGSWVAMCMDPKGRLIVSDQYGKLYRLTLPPLNVATEPQIEVIDAEIGCAQGLLYAFHSLYVMVNEEKFQGRGLYRLRDTNGDDKFDDLKLVRELQGGGEHGPQIGRAHVLTLVTLYSRMPSSA